MPSRITPCIWTGDHAEAAAALYTATLPDARVTATSRYPTDRDNPAGKPRGAVITMELDVAGQRLTLLDGGPRFRPNPSVSFFVQVDEADARRIFAALADGGRALMPLGAYPWSPCYGWVADRFGVSWQIMSGAGALARAVIEPALTFVGPVHGRAGEAIEAYSTMFPGGSIDHVERYTAAEGPAGTVKHARFTVAGQPMIAMDGPGAHPFRFDEGVSFQLRCADQAELDQAWAALTAGGKPGPCGWLTDRFGVSWQVIPDRLGAWMSGADPAASGRAFAAMMTMSKLDLAALERAYAGLA